MRETLFRGKTKSGKWKYGDLIQHEGKEWKGIASQQSLVISAYTVIPETVGQYIRVKGYEGDYENRHKNEVKLFEDDIVEAMSKGSKGTFVIRFRNESQPTFVLFPAWQGGKMWSIAASDVGRAKGDYYDDLRRIGNIHDNPELIKT